MTPIASFTLPFALAVSVLAGGCSKQAPQQAANNPQQYPQQQNPQETPNAAGQQAINPNQAPVQQQAPPQQQATSGYAPQRRSAPRRERAAPPEAQSAAQTDAQSAPESAPAPAPVPAPPPVPVSYTIPAGTHLRVTTREDLGSKISRPGESFSATVTNPVVVRGVTLIRAGSPASGTVIDAKSLGRFKGQATLALRLDSVRSGGHTYQVESSTIDRVEKGKGKRTAILAGGGGGLGALIGGLAGGGKGALIGGLLGAGGGGAGAAFTGNKEIVIPAETPLTFRLTQSVSVSR